MIERSLQKDIEKLTKAFPAIVVLGPRQVGKTTLIKQVVKKSKRKSLYLDLERTSDYETLKRDAQEYLLSYKEHTVLIDEIQRMPQLFPLLRAVIDEKRKAGRRA